MNIQSPFIFVIFGATGELTKKKLFPALFSLFKKGGLPETFFIIGFSRRKWSTESFIASFPEYSHDEKWKEFSQHIQFQQGEFSDSRAYQELAHKLQGLDEKQGACITRIFYLATPPHHYQQIITLLKESSLSEGCGQGSSKWTRIAIEKPFGNNLETARDLDAKLGEIFEEKQIFRVDHYLGKETVQNMLVFRFANSIFDPIWKSEYIDHVQIVWSEKQGVDPQRVSFDEIGLLRDVAQNHLLQLMATVAMESPKAFSKEGVREARAAAVQSIELIKPQEKNGIVVRGQYEGYMAQSQKKTTETFVAMKVYMNTPRLQHVPFYIRAGKKLAKDTVEIAVVFKQTCHILFKEVGCPEEGNVLRIKIQPDEGITMRMITKKPGNTLSLGTVDLKFSYKEAFGDIALNAYEKLLVDILVGDQMLFNRSDELESSWNFITSVLAYWEKTDAPVYQYKEGTLGPQEAIDLIEQDGRTWVE